MTETQARALVEARRWLGTPFVHGASCRGAGADCAGLIRGIWRALHGAEPWEVPPYSADWAELADRDRLGDWAREWLVPCPPGAGAPGDVLLFRLRPGGLPRHLGLLSAVGASPRFIHAYSGHAVTESPLSCPWARRIAARFRFPERFP